jgi:hypothetical protein
MNKSTFIDVDNGITIGKNCHMKVTFNDGYKELVRRIAEEKDKDTYQRLLEQSLLKQPFLEWKSIGWLEEQITILEDLIAGLAYPQGDSPVLRLDKTAKRYDIRAFPAS